MATLESQAAVGEISPIEGESVGARTDFGWMTRGLSLAAVLLFIILALTPNGATRITLWPWSLLASLLALVPIVLMFLLKFDQRLSLGPDANLLFGLLAATLVFSALISSFAFQSLEVSLLALGMFATVFCTAAYVTSGYSGERGDCLRRWIGWFGFAFSLVSLLSWTLGTLQWEALRVSEINWNAGETIIEWNAFNFRNESPLGHSNHTAGLTLLLLPWMFALVAHERRWKRLWWLAVSGLVALVLFTSGSRGAVIGLGAILLSYLVILSVRRSMRPRTLLALGVVAVIGLALGALSQPRVRSLIQDWNASGELNSGDEQRWNMLKAGWMMGADNPILGQGPGVTPLTYPAYRSQLDGGVESALQLHALPLQVWADLGLIGVAILLGLGFVAVRRIHAFLRSDRDGGDDTVLHPAFVPAAVSATGYLAFSLTDFQLDVPVFAGFLAINLGLIFGITRKNRKGPIIPLEFLERIPRAARIGAVLLLLAPVLWTTVHALLARQAFSAAVDKLERGNAKAYVDGVRTAMEWAPDNAFYPTAAAVGLLRFTSQGVSRESMLTLRAEAADLFAESLIIDETQEIAHFNRGWLLLPTDAAAAERHFRRAAELVPDKGGVYLGRGLAGFEKGDREAALDGFALEIFNDPKFATAPFWDIPEFAPLRGPALRRAVAFLTKTEEGVEGLSPKTKAVMRDTALILADLASDEPPGPLLTSRSEAAVTVAKADPGSRTAAIEDHFFRQRHRFIHSDPLDAYEALFTRTGADPKAMLADPAGKEPPLMRQTQRERPGYGVLMRNLDVPLPIDAYVVQENAVVGDFFPGLFPPKGYLPTTVLMEIAATTGDALK